MNRRALAVPAPRPAIQSQPTLGVVIDSVQRYPFAVLRVEEVTKTMYLDYYRLKKHPFKITCDPAFLWLSEKHKEALANLRYGLTANRGFVLLTGEVGTGKTLLVNKLLTMLPEDTVAASISGHNVDSADFYRLLAERMRLPYTFIDKSEFLIEFEKFVRTADTDGRRVVLIVDEAQMFGNHVIEDIRMLSNIELPERKLVSVFLVGQPELNQSLLESNNTALVQRITSRYHLTQLDEQETETYINHRLWVAGNSSGVFSKSAVRRIFDYTGGTPRLINILCDRAMLTGNVHNLEVIEADTISECANELSIPELTDQPDATEPRAWSTFANASTARQSENRVNDNGKKGKIPLGAQHQVRKPNKFRLSRLIYAGIVPAVLFSLTLAFMTFDTMPPNPGTNEKQTTMRPEKSSLATHTEEQAHDLIDWPEKGEIHVYFDQSNSIDQNCKPTIDHLAKRLRTFPEQSIFVHSYTDDATPSQQWGAIWQERVDTLRSYLIQRGVYAYQIKVVETQAKSSPIPPDGRILQPVLLAYHQGRSPDIYSPDIYNEDK